MADKTEMKIRKLFSLAIRDLFKKARNRVSFTPSSKTDSRMWSKYWPYSRAQVHASLPTETITTQKFYHII